MELNGRSTNGKIVSGKSTAYQQPAVSVALVRRLKATPEAVFAAWTEAQLVAKWLAPGANTVTAVTTDLRKGGRYRIDGIDGDGESYSICGTYLDLVKDRRVAMSWVYDGPAASLRGPASVVIADLRWIDAGLTELTLTHEKLDDRQSAELNRVNWISCLDKLPAAAPSAGGAQALADNLQPAEFYTDAQRALQDQFDTRRLADRLQSVNVEDKLSAVDAAFVTRQNMFFLATTDGAGQPSCSYKGGARGFVSVIDDRTLAFPSYDGSGMYLSAGNIADTGKVALLFVDFERQARLRIQGTARVSDNDRLMTRYPGAQLIVRVTVDVVFPNCPRYIHKMHLVEESAFIPDDQSSTPVPEWKRLMSVADVLPEKDQHLAGTAMNADKALNRD